MTRLPFVKPKSVRFLSHPVWLALLLLFTSAGSVRGDDRFVGSWVLDEGFQIVEILFRSDGRYQIDTRSTDPDFGFFFTERGRYEVAGTGLSLHSYEYFGEPEPRRYEFLFDRQTLSLTRVEFSLTEIYQFKTRSKEQVLAQEKAEHDPVGKWRRGNASAGTDEYLFRPGGYYVFVRTHSGSPFPPEILRGRYWVEGSRLTLRPYGGVEAPYELDFFGETLTLIRQEPFSGDATGYDLVAGSRTEVRTKAAEADAFLAGDDWQVGVWEIRDPFLTVDLTLRPDGHYTAVNSTEFLNGTVRGRYFLEPRRIQLLPFIGQDLYARSNGEFGKVERTRELDYYDGELQFIDLEAISQSVVIARKRAGSDVAVADKSRQAQTERAVEGWHLGNWEVQDPLGWMQFTLRPDGRYLAQSGTGGLPSQVERGRYVVGSDKITLAPYAGLGSARGFELDLYDGDLFLAGDPVRLVIARKIPGSAAEVVEKTQNPVAMNGERGTILGRWTADLPGQSTELVFRNDGQFRLDRCAQSTASRDYGLYQVDMASRTLVLDSRFAPVQTLGLDFYGDTLTIYGGLSAPSTYGVHLGEVDAAIAASLAADEAREQVDTQWLDRVPVAPRNPDAVLIPTGDIPADPFPGRIFTDPTVLTSYRLYRRLIPGFVYFNVQGVIRSVAVVHTREWHFFPTGRVLVRFKNYYAGAFYPSTVVEVSDSWGAYHIDPQPSQSDILHLFADNSVWFAMDSGDEIEMTLEDGRRHLFWEKDYQILSEWASEQQPVPCESPDEVDPSLLNTGISLSTHISPDDVGGLPPVLLGIVRSVSGELTLQGTMDTAGSVVIEVTSHLGSSWQALQTNQVPAGAFTLPVPGRAEDSGFFRIRRP